MNTQWVQMFLIYPRSSGTGQHEGCVIRAIQYDGNLPELYCGQNRAGQTPAVGSQHHGQSQGALSLALVLIFHTLVLIHFLGTFSLMVVNLLLGTRSHSQDHTGKTFPGTI